LGNRAIIARKEFRSLLTEKTLLLAILIQLFIALFSSFLVVGLVSLYNPGALEDYNFKDATLGVVGDSDGVITGLIRSDDKLSVITFQEMDDAEEAFFAGTIDGILSIPDVSIDGDEPIEITLYLPKDSIEAMVIMIHLKEPLEAFEERVRQVRGVDVPTIDLDLPEGTNEGKKSTEFFEFIYTLLIPLLMLTPAFISGGLMIDFITEEIDRKTLDMLLVSPIRLIEIVDGKLFVATIIAPIQALCWLILLYLNGIAVQNILLTVTVVLLVTAILTLLCSILSLRLIDRGKVQLLYSLLLVLFFTITCTYPVIPFNLIARLTLGSSGVRSDAIVVIAIYAVCVAMLYWILQKLSRSYNISAANG